MVKRSTPQREIDDRNFPVRVFVQIPEGGFGLTFGAGPRTINTWLDREIGRGDYAQHAGRGRVSQGRESVAFYFRSPNDASRFLAAYPELDLADGTAMPGYTSPTFPSGRK